ncbi:MAG: transporter substrate-binding domain-containing protein [Paludibacterium sp.]|uniref:substrate-binding periplasmic protein n=1 Tax=Paludibacterium sp. TaxID=1917523 RepID=UPI0025E094EE|nr:transporter substrate-binding domain-containing protein [Paludibacterium sp.]MBV8048434.1 transporter substrate-binding domain-containing protein [Paludibacterium sp.]MBV8649228.1 transporter substrate-binding domain-containing protein [Paludibacterium sp.]
MGGNHSARRFVWACCLAVTAWLAGGAAAWGEPVLQLVTENQPPLNFEENGHAVGVSTAVVAEMLRRAHLSGQFSVLPWSRAFAMTQQTANTCIYSIVRSPERAPLFHWVGPIAVNQWVLYAGPAFKGHLDTLDDARPYRIGGTLHDAKSDYLRTQGFTRLELVGDEELNARKLLAGHLDLWIAAAGRAQTLISLAPYHGIRPLLAIGKSDQYLACHPETSPEMLAALNQALQSMRKDGSLRALTGMFSPIP